MTAPRVSHDHLVAIDAFTGSVPVTGTFASNVVPWALVEPDFGTLPMRPDTPDEADWADPRVGWGVILSEPPDRGRAELEALADAPPALQRLVSARGGKVLRYRPGSSFQDWTLRDYAGGGDLLTAASPSGMGAKQLPKYLLIYGTPRQVPWHVQQMLNPVRYVGRLDLEGDALERYVDALLDGWSSSAASYANPVVWAVDHGNGDITTLMRDTIAETVHAAMAGDDEMDPVFLDGSSTAATGEVLVETLLAHHPAFVVTSSHGMTGPLDDIDAMRTNLGLLVDQQHEMLTPERVLESWQPDGAVWFAQACCSAGAESPTAYDGLFDATSTLHKVLTGVASAGPAIAPLPRALLGADKPLRAFIGHVEPTFDWTLSFPPNRQVLTADLVRCLYDGLASARPVGLAMNSYYRPIGALLQGYLKAKKDYDKLLGDAARPSLDMMVYSRVTAHDRASTVILGDPTATVPLPV